jgi:hypothetical protein
MTDRLPAIDLPNMVAAFRSERTEMLDFTRSLTDDEWRAPSAAAGWSIADVVGHIAGLGWRRRCTSPPADRTRPGSGTATNG